MVLIELINGGGCSPSTPPSPPPFPTSFPYPFYEPAVAFPAPIQLYHPPNPYPYGFGFAPYGYSQPPPPPPAEWYDLNQQPQPQPWMVQVQAPQPGYSGMNPGRVSGYGGPKLEKGTTTLMIRNLPTKLRRHELLDLLDEHCRKENKTSARLARKRHSAYDFLYLPFDFVRGGNLGYAFVNLTTPGAAFRFFNSWNGKGWFNFYKCSKICAITRANIQGKEASKRHLAQCKFFCDTEEFLPVEFSPPRDGYNTNLTKMVTFGIWVSKDESSVSGFGGRKSN
ncbi:hypothetical protein V2J09_013889 [Rumex salicifolius]